MNNRIFLSFLLLVAVTISFSFASAVYAQSSASTAIADAEIEREKQITQELSLNMPDQTDDPNYPITFVDPSKQGVDITIDDKTTTKAPSPFLLPNLSIGQHKVIFKFKTKDGVVRVLTKNLLITPKAPQFDQTLKTQVTRPAQVTLTGTALPQSTIMLVTNSTAVHKISSNVDGKWEFIVPEPKEGENNIVAFTIRNGIVSAASKTFSVTYLRTATSENNNNDSPPASLESQLVDKAKALIMNIENNRTENPKLFYGVIGGALIVILLIIDLRLRRSAAKNKEEKTIASLLGNLQKGPGTIVDAIQSVQNKEKTPTDVQQSKAKKTKKQEPPEIGEEVLDPVVPEITPKKQEKATKAVKNKTVKVKSERKVIKSTPLEIEEATITPEDPEKKVLSKDEFLKQFQKDDEQDG